MGPGNTTPGSSQSPTGFTAGPRPCGPSATKRWAEAQSIEKAGDIDERHEQVNRSGYSGDCFDCVTRPEQCAPVGDGRRFSISSQAKSPRRKAESPTLPLPDTERIRHQTGCGCNQAQTIWGEAVAGTRGLRHRAGACESHSQGRRRNAGGADRIDPIFQPNNGVPTRKVSRCPGRFNPRLV